MGALAELICAVFDSICPMFERGSKQPGWLFVLLVLGVSVLVALLILEMVWVIFS